MKKQESLQEKKKNDLKLPVNLLQNSALRGGNHCLEAAVQKPAYKMGSRGLGQGLQAAEPWLSGTRLQAGPWPVMLDQKPVGDPDRGQRRSGEAKEADWRGRRSPKAGEMPASEVF